MSTAADSTSTSPLALLDTHIHLWQRPELEPVGVLRHRLLRQPFWVDALPSSPDVRVEGFVYVQASAVDIEMCEASSVRMLRAAGHPIVGFVAHLQLDDGATSSELARLSAVTPLSGVRRVVQGEADRSCCRSSAFLLGATELASSGLALDVLALPDQLSSLAQLACELPQLRIVVNHLGKPGRPAPEQAWYAGVDLLGSCPNVYWKLSPPMHTERDAPLSERWIARVLQTLLDAISPTRLLFASNWPVCTPLVSFEDWLRHVIAAVGDRHGLAGLHDVLARNARSVYALSPGGDAG